MRRFAFLLFMLSAAALSAAVDTARLEHALGSLHASYDEAEQMIRRPFSSPGYHTTLTGGFVHPTRDSLHYALALLDTGKPAHLERAQAILRRVIALQDTDPASRTYGIWSWFLEEPLPKMSPPDWNWADFNGVTLLQVIRDHRERIGPDLAREVEASILHAAAAIKRRNVGPHYTNIAIMGAYVTLIAGETLQMPEFAEYGLARLQRFHDYTMENGTFEEYNSPTYTQIALLELSRLHAHTQNPRARQLLEPLLRLAWREIASHFHAPTRQWAGPHSRTYRSLLPESTLALIQRGSGGRVDFGTDHFDRDAHRIPLACPADLLPQFAALDSARTVTQTFIRRNQTIGTTYLHPKYALGTINRGDLWNQRRALLLHFGSAASPGYLHLRFLKNGYDFASAILHANQREGLAVGAINLISNGGDTHISLQKVKDAKFSARDLRVRFELGGPAGLAARTSATDSSATIIAGPLQIQLSVPYARLGTATGRLLTDGDDKTRWCDVVLYEGKERTFDLAALEEAIVGFVLSVGPHGLVTAKVEGEQLLLESDGLRVTAARRPHAQ